MQEAYRIEIPIDVLEQSGPALNRAQERLTRFEAAVGRTHRQLERISGTRWQVAVDLSERVSTVLAHIKSDLLALVKETFSLTMGTVNLVSSPLRSMLEHLPDVQDMSGMDQSLQVGGPVPDHPIAGFDRDSSGRGVTPEKGAAPAGAKPGLTPATLEMDGMASHRDLVYGLHQLHHAWAVLQMQVDGKTMPGLRRLMVMLTSAAKDAERLAIVVGGRLTPKLNIFARALESLRFGAGSNVWATLRVAWDDLVIKPFDEWWQSGGAQAIAQRTAQIAAVFGASSGEGAGAPGAGGAGGLNGGGAPGGPIIPGKQAGTASTAVDLFAEAGARAGQAFFIEFLKALDVRQLANKLADASLSVHSGSGSPATSSQAALSGSRSFTDVVDRGLWPLAMSELTKNLVKSPSEDGNPSKASAGQSGSVTRKTPTVGETVQTGGPGGILDTSGHLYGQPRPKPQPVDHLGRPMPWPSELPATSAQPVRTWLNRVPGLERIKQAVTSSPKASRMLKMGTSMFGRMSKGFSTVSKAVGPALLPLAIAADVFDIATAAPGVERSKAVGGAVGGWLGAGLGLLGGPVGAAIGSVAGRWLGEQVGGWLGGRKAKAAALPPPETPVPHQVGPMYMSPTHYETNPMYFSQTHYETSQMHYEMGPSSGEFAASPLQVVPVYVAELALEAVYMLQQAIIPTTPFLPHAPMPALGTLGSALLAGQVGPRKQPDWHTGLPEPASIQVEIKVEHKPTYHITANGGVDEILNVIRANQAEIADDVMQKAADKLERVLPNVLRPLMA